MFLQIDCAVCMTARNRDKDDGVNGMCDVQCSVFGPAQSGKSSLLRALASPEEATPSGKKSTQPCESRQREGSVTAVVPLQTEAAQSGMSCILCLY